MYPHTIHVNCLYSFETELGEINDTFVYSSHVSKHEAQSNMWLRYSFNDSSCFQIESLSRTQIEDKHDDLPTKRFST